MPSLSTPLCGLLGIEHPIVQAPMAGGPTTPELVAAVSQAGALGSFGHAYTAPGAMRQEAEAARARTSRPFNVNLFAAPLPEEPPLAVQQAAIGAVAGLLARFGAAPPARVPPPYAPDLAEQIDAVCAIRPRVLTIHLGDLPSATVARLKGLGIALGSAATSVREARHVEAMGADFVIAQGGEAGGHRGTFLGPPSKP